MSRPDLQPRANSRRELVATRLLVAEELIAHHELPPSGVTAGRQLAITYAGAFEFQVGRNVTWVDPSRILFAEAKQSFVDHHVVPRTGHRSVILTPRDDALGEICADVNPHFLRGVACASPRLQMLAQRLRRPSHAAASQEIGIELLAECFRSSRRPAATDPKCVRRAKVILHDCSEGRLTLVEVADELGVSPVHLTQAFKRAEGVPLYRYQTRLRLARALEKLPGHRDISDLAFELGYSSHSHFAAAFRAEFGVSPSHFRSGCPENRDCKRQP